MLKKRNILIFTIGSIILGIIVWVIIKPNTSFIEHEYINKQDTDSIKSTFVPNKNEKDNKSIKTEYKQSTKTKLTNLKSDKKDIAQRKQTIMKILMLLSSKATTKQSNRKNELAKTPFDKQYIKDQMKEIVPYVKECYDIELEKNPILSGSLTVKFSIIGDPELGGIIESSEVVDGTLKDNNSINECVRESIYALELNAPDKLGRVTVNYPFIFNHD